MTYALEIANKGWKKAVFENKALALGVNTVNGYVAYKAVAEAHGLPYIPLSEAV